MNSDRRMFCNFHIASNCDVCMIAYFAIKLRWLTSVFAYSITAFCILSYAAGLITWILKINQYVCHSVAKASRSLFWYLYLQSIIRDLIILLILLYCIYYILLSLSFLLAFTLRWKIAIDYRTCSDLWRYETSLLRKST